MHVLFVHKNFPAQFGHIAKHLIDTRGDTCSFVSEKGPGDVEGIKLLQYRLSGGATEQTHYFSRTFENGVWHASGIYDACKSAKALLDPVDLIVGHSGFGSTLFLRELWPDTPVISYFEYFYRPVDSDLDFRPDRPPEEPDRLRSYARNAMILLDMEYCTAGYSPMHFQHGLMPEAYKPKIRVLHDGIDTEVWAPRENLERTLGNLKLAEGERLVTYVSRGFETMRGFDVFMKAAKRIYTEFPDVRFVVVGKDQVSYGGDLKHTGGKSYRDWVLAQDDYDLSKILFVGNQQPDTLAKLLALSDLHIYLTVPFVLSWSMLNAMSTGAVVLGSDTAPVQEVIADGQNGLLAGFFDDEAIAARALEVLREPERFAAVGAAARQTVEERYSMEVLMPRMCAFYDEVAAGAGQTS